MARLIDTTLRDGVQCLWSSRLEARHIVPIARSIDLAGYQAVDFMALVQFEVSVKHLKENPWERLRAVKALMKRTPLIAHVRSRSLTSFDLVAEEVIRLWIERLAAHGLKHLMILDALHDLDNIRFSLKIAKEHGFQVTPIIFYTISPIHTDGYYAALAERMARIGADAVCIRDPSGLLTPQRTRELVALVRSKLHGIPLQLKSHCTTGLAEDCYMEALRAGVDAVFTATTPLANGASVPAAEAIAARCAAEGIDVGTHAARLADIADYFIEVAAEQHKPLGKKVAETNPSQYEHQVPGGMISFLRDQLRAMDKEALLPQVLEEIPRVRADFGYPVVVTPLSQLIGAQAMLNVVQGERYRTIPVEVQKYVLGHYGKPEGPLDGGLVDRVHATRGPGAGSRPEDGVIARIRRQFGPFGSDDDLLLHLLFRPEHLAGIVGAPAAAQKPSPVVERVRELLKSASDLADISVDTPEFRFSARRLAKKRASLTGR